MEYSNNFYDIVNREIIIPITISTFVVRGDSNSKILNFRIQRVYDGIDLSNKDIYICYKNNIDQTNEKKAQNISYSNSVLMFDIVIPADFASISGDVTSYIEFRSLDYTLKTKTFNTTCEDSFEVFSDTTDADYSIENAFLSSSGGDRIDRKDLQDSDIPFRVIDRDIIMDIKKTICVLKDNMSQILTFRLKRFVNGIDRSKMTFIFYYKNAKNETDMCFASNIFFTEDEIFIGWAISSKVTKCEGNIIFKIGIIGQLLDKSDYRWYTKATSFLVESSMDITGTMDVQTKDWYDSWVMEADNAIKQASTFSNTAKEYYTLATTASSNITSILADAQKLLLDMQTMLNTAKDYAYEIGELQITRENKDALNHFMLVKYNRPDGTLYMTSTLQTEDGTVYNTRLEQRYGLDGVTVISSRQYPIIYDYLGVVLGKFNNLNQFLYHGFL